MNGPWRLTSLAASLSRLGWVMPADHCDCLSWVQSSSSEINGSLSINFHERQAPILTKSSARAQEARSGLLWDAHHPGGGVGVARLGTGPWNTILGKYAVCYKGRHRSRFCQTRSAHSSIKLRTQFLAVANTHDSWKGNYAQGQLYNVVQLEASSCHWQMKQPVLPSCIPTKQLTCQPPAGLQQMWFTEEKNQTDLLPLQK